MIAQAAQASSEVPAWLLIVLAGVVVALLGWTVKELYRTSGVLTKLEERSEDHGRRLERLERQS